MIHIINKTRYFIVFKCSHCNKVHIEFNNFNLNLSEPDYSNFVQYIRGLEGDYWTAINNKSIYRRKIRIPITQTTTCLMLHTEELYALQQLLVLPEYIIEKMLVEKLQESVCWS